MNRCKKTNENISSTLYPVQQPYYQFLNYFCFFCIKCISFAFKYLCLFNVCKKQINEIFKKMNRLVARGCSVLWRAFMVT